MTEENIDDAKFSSLIIKVDDSPVKTMKSPLRKRCVSFSPIPKIEPKRRCIIDTSEYKSPLIHLGKTRIKNSLDESIVVLEELTRSTHLKSPTLPLNGSKSLVAHNESVIILSDNEEETEKNFNGSKNCNTKLNDVAEANLKLAEIAVVEKPKRKKNVQSNSVSITPKGKVKIRKTTAKSSSLKSKQSLASNLIFDTLKAQAAGINSENENTGIQKNEVTFLNTSKNVEKVIKDANINSQSAETSSSLTATQDEISIVWMANKKDDAAEDQLVTFSKLQKCTVVYTDTEGDLPPLCHQNISKQTNRICKRKKKRQNPGHAALKKNGSSEYSLIKKSNQSKVNRIGSYYTEETIVKRPGSLRDIVIDGCNVAMAYTNNKYFSEVGLKLVIDYFKLRGHAVKAFVPQHKRSIKRKLLETLYTQGIVVFTPSRLVGKRRISSYDDRYILDYAVMCEGIVVSSDQYRDLYKEKSEWKNIIENRLLVPTFVGKCVMFPEDPLGRQGPKLEQFLRH